jgi:hypothetical protein
MQSMTTPLLPPFDTDEADRARMAQMQELATGLDRMLLVATALIEMGRPVELAGIEAGMGRLCAGTLDLPPALGRELRPSLIALRTRLDAAEGTLRLRYATD